MILCLRCYRISPAGSQYCTSCGTALGVRYCDSGHASSLYAQHCRSCGSGSLSDGTMTLSLRPLSYLLSLGLLILCIRWALVHYGEVFAGIWGLARSGAAALFFGGQVGLVDRLLCCASKYLYCTLNWMVMAWIIGLMLWMVMPESKGGAVGKLLRGLPISLLNLLLMAFPLCWKLLTALCRGVAWLFFSIGKADVREDKASKA